MFDPYDAFLFSELLLPFWEVLRIIIAAGILFLSFQLLRLLGTWENEIAANSSMNITYLFQKRQRKGQTQQGRAAVPVRIDYNTFPF